MTVSISWELSVTEGDRIAMGSVGSNISRQRVTLTVSKTVCIGGFDGACPITVKLTFEVWHIGWRCGWRRRNWSGWAVTNVPIPSLDYRTTLTNCSKKGVVETTANSRCGVLDVKPSLGVTFSEVGLAISRKSVALIVS